MDIYRMRDVDNRVEDGAPFETTGSLNRLAGYIDQIVRYDVKDSSEVDIDQIVSQMKSGIVPETELRRLGIYVTKETAES